MINVVISDDPPAEKNGRGTPVAGRAPETTAILSKAWERIIVTRPHPSKRLNELSFRNDAI